MLTLPLPITPVAAGLPDADFDVIVFLDDGETTLGALDETGWVDAGGMTFAHRGQRVVAWSDFPALPVGATA